MTRVEIAWLDAVLRRAQQPEPFEHDAIQLACDNSADDDDDDAWRLGHVEG